MTKLSYLAVAELKNIFTNNLFKRKCLSTSFFNNKYFIIFSEELFPFFSDRLYWFIYMTSTILVFL